MNLEITSQALDSTLQEQCLIGTLLLADCVDLLRRKIEIDQQIRDRVFLNAKPLPFIGKTPVSTRHSAGSAESIEVSSAEGAPVRIKVFYATERQVTASSEVRFGDERARNGLPTYGVAAVSIPPNHVKGEVESPVWWKFEFEKKSARHFTASLAIVGERDFYRAIRNQLGYCAKKQVFVFVHGYFVTFDDALLKTAQIAADIGFDGAPVMYDWPSRGTVEDYVADKTSINDSVQDLASFLQNMASLTGATTVNVIAHSMGNYGLLTALDNLVTANRLPALNQLILAAPDIDVLRIKQIVPRLVATGKIGRITLYASQHDLALKASAKVNRIAAAGQAPPTEVLEGIDTIDASAVEGSFFGHDYFATTRAVLSDIWLLFKDGSPPRFGMDKVPHKNGPYWQFTKTAY